MDKRVHDAGRDIEPGEQRDADGGRADERRDAAEHVEENRRLELVAQVVRDLPRIRARRRR